MSLAFREVYKEFSTESRAQSKNPASDKISDVFHIGDKLLLSNDNMRPKSRSKTCINGQDFHKVTPCDSDFRRQHSTSASTALQRYLTEDISLKTHNDVLSPLTINKEIRDISNNAQDSLELHIDSVKKGKRTKKRSNLNNKAKKGKHGRILATANGLQERRTPAQGQNSSTNTQHLKSRVSSEPPSKASQSSVVSYTLLDTANGNTHNHTSNISSTNVKLHDLYPLRVASAKTNSNTLPSTHYVHGNLTCNPILNNLNSTQCIEAQGQSVLLYKLDMNSRVKSASSLKSDSVSQVNSLKSGVSDITITTDELALNAVSCNIQKQNRPNKTLTKYYQQKTIQSNGGLSDDSVSKEAVLTSIYGAVYHTADLVSAQVEELKKMKKIFLSEKQSGTIREGGMEFPCAPPATPTPDLLRKHEFVPSMSDIRSQRAVKSRLQVMEKEALRKQEKKKEAHAKQEKQQMKDRDKIIKAKQRREIYALNKIMTELENKRFLEFCHAKGLNKV